MEGQILTQPGSFHFRSWVSDLTCTQMGKSGVLKNLPATPNWLRLASVLFNITIPCEKLKSAFVCKSWCILKKNQIAYYSVLLPLLPIKHACGGSWAQQKCCSWCRDEWRLYKLRLLKCSKHDSQFPLHHNSEGKTRNVISSTLSQQEFRGCWAFDPMSSCFNMKLVKG